MNIRDKTVSDNIGLVHACAKRFKGRGIEYDDLFQAGCIGLIKAIDGFDKSRGLKLSTYAVPVILGEIKRLFRDGGAIKVGRSLKELSLKVNRESSLFQSKYGREPTVAELASIFSVDAEQIAQAIECSQVPVSLTIQEDGTQEIDIIVESHDEKVSEKLALKQIIEELDFRDRNLIILRFFKNQTQTQTAKLLGMTQVQVSRRERAILKEIRKKLA